MPVGAVDRTGFHRGGGAGLRGGLPCTTEPAAEETASRRHGDATGVSDSAFKIPCQTTPSGRGSLNGAADGGAKREEKVPPLKRYGDRDGSVALARVKDTTGLTCPKPGDCCADFMGVCFREFKI